MATLEGKSPTQSDQPSGEYDPHAHRTIDKATTNMETLIHLVKCCLGTGILAIPQAFARTGLVTGIIGTIFVGILLTHCLQMLIKMQYRVCQLQRVPQLTYPQCISAAILNGPPRLHSLAKPFARSVDVFLITYQLGVCCVYIVFIADNMKKMIDPVREMSLIEHMLILLVPLVAFNLIPSLKLLAPFSLLANLLTLVGIGIIVYYLIATKKAAEEDLMDYWGTATQVPLFFGTIMFALTSVPVVVALEKNMQNPKDFTKFFGVLNIGMTFIVALYSIVGALGYRFCVSVCSDSITLDLPNGATSLSVQIMMCVAIFISYGLHCYVPVEVIFQNYVLPALEARNASKRKIFVAEYLVRVGLCLFTIITAMLVPRLGLIISLFGALCLSALGMCFPTLMEICLFYPDKYGPCKIYLMKDIFLFLFGIVGLVAGTYSAISAIIESFM